MSCQLNLTLASSPLQINNHHHYSPQIPPLSQNFRKTTPESDTRVSLPKNSLAGQGRALFSSREVAVAGGIGVVIGLGISAFALAADSIDPRATVATLALPVLFLGLYQRRQITVL